MLAGSKWGGHPATLLAVLKSIVRSEIDYGCSIYGGAEQKWLNKITVAYNKGLRICLRSLRTTAIPALEVEAGSIPLTHRRSYLARKEILKSFEYELPICKRFEINKNNLDEFGLTFLEINSLEISTLTDSICRS